MSGDPERIDGDALHRERYAWAAKWITCDPVADVGCGTGYGMRELCKRDDMVIGFDYCDVGASPFVRCDIGLQTFRGFELVVALEVFSHLPDPLTWLKGLECTAVVISMPLVASASVYPYRKHDFTEAQFRAFFPPRWAIEDELRQARYLTVYAVRSDMP